MTSALSPRDIQTRIRSGASLEELVRECGMPLEKVEPFAAPVLAEREHVAGTALQCPVRRRGETGSVRAMRAVVEEKLAAQQVNMEDVAWDAWRNEDRRWTVVGRWQHDGEGHEAQFIFDQRARFSVATNDAARLLIGEVTASTAPRPVVTAADAEPTIDLHDELAVLRAVQGEVPSVTAAQPVTPEPSVESSTRPAPESKAVPVQPSEPAEPGLPAGASTRPAPETVSVPVAPPTPEQLDDGDEEEVQDYSPAELEEVDGVYDFVPQNTSDMDVLYEMLSSFAEDSVNIYAGLANPVTQEPAADLTEDEPATDEIAEGSAPAPSPEPAEVDASAAVLDGAEVERPEVEPEPEEEHPALASLDDAEPVEEPVDQPGDGAPTSDATPMAEPVEAPGEAGDADAEPSALIELPAQAPVAVPTTPVVVEVAQPEAGEHTIEVPLDKLGDRGSETDASPVTEPVEAPDHGSEVDASPVTEPVEALDHGSESDASPITEPVEAPDRGSETDASPVTEPVETPAPASPEVPEQDALVETPEQPATAARPRPKPRPRKKRASIPSWDEIMFGGPTPPKQG